ncbi:hypothetical protein HN388_05890 [bacterium]|jgi:hypothetical protein|nr:hypothetical protein [bacterium]MBT7311726.1 hypothetical protein [bacterium]
MKLALLLLLMLSIGFNIGFVMKSDQPQEIEMSCDTPGAENFCKENMNSMCGDMMPKMRSGRKNVMQARMALREAIRNPELTEGQLLERVSQVAIAQGQLDSLAATSLFEILKAASPEEREEVLRCLPFGPQSRHRGPKHRR